jgi:subtilisin family serine protease
VTTRLIAAVGLTIALGAPAAAQRQADLTRALDAMRGPVEFPEAAVRAKAALERRSEKIDPALLLLTDEVQSKGYGDFASKAAGLGVPVEGRRVLVTLLAEEENDVDRVRREAMQRGGDVQAVFENAVYVEIAAEQIESLNAVDALEYAMPQGIFEPTRVQTPRASGVRSEGVLAAKVEHLHAANVTGRNVRIGILDFGFQGLSRLVAAGEVPRPKDTKSFGSATVENGEVHGAACAEIIHDMAPAAELYLASVGDGQGSGEEGQIVAAVQWLASKNVQIISFSGGGHMGPHNGTSKLDRLVNATVREHGIFWVNAAGNEGDEHFGGMASDRDGDGVIEFSGGYNGVAFQAARGAVAVSVSWDDWGDNPSVPTSSQDIDAFLFAVDAQGRGQLVAQSTNPQNGRGRPMEFVSVTSPDPNQIFVLKLRASRVTRPVRLHVFELAGARMEPKNAQGSIGLPATAQYALAVGAVDVTKAVLEAYSSQGPTDDDRQKPEVSAPDRNSTVSYRANDPEGRFPGTSAACPHVAGFAALLKQLNPSAKPEDMKALVIKNVRDMGPAGPDPGYGHGHIDGSKLSARQTTDVTNNDTPTGGFPQGFGEALSDQQFERLWDIARREPADGLRVVTGSQEYTVGDGLKVGIRSDRACNFMLVHRSSDGEFTILSSSDERGGLQAGERYALPEGETWKIQPPAGRDGLLLVCSPGRIDLAGWMQRPDDRVWLATTTFEVKR